MLGLDDIDAVYISTPTAARERIAVAAARAGKHVLGEKPFTSLASLRRITSACRQHGVCFMDATHFVHHPRHAEIKKNLAEMIGAPMSLETRFLIDLTNRDNIRFDPSLEPLGALGDLGWYNLRATLEYFPAKARLKNVTASLKRDTATQAVVAAEGSLAYDDGSVSRWRCSFGSATVDIGLDLAGPSGALHMENFIGEDADGSARFDYLSREAPGAPGSVTRGNASTSGPALMFREFAVAVADPSQREHWMRASERTQSLLDAVWQASTAA
jgi:predicted dehydrogenase